MRQQIAKIMYNLTPSPPSSGPPLPEFIPIDWPNFIRSKIPNAVHGFSSNYTIKRSQLMHKVGNVPFDF